MISHCGYASQDDLHQAVAAANAASRAWAVKAPAERGKVLLAMAKVLESRFREFVALESHHGGKTIGDAEIDIRGSIGTLQWFAGCAERLDGRVVASASTIHRYVRREPLGVCALILPWNFPLLLMLWKLAPALAAGNTVVVKPASETPLSTLAFAALAVEAGLPPGVFNVLPGSGREIGMWLATHPDIAKVSFTGSTEVGIQVARAAAGSVKRVTLELGGKSPAVILEDADLDRAAIGTAAGVFGHAGQKCAARTRCIVVESVADALVEKIAARAKLLKAGEAPQKILGGVTFTFRKLAEATERARAGTQLRDAISGSGIFPNAIGPSEAYLRRIGFERASRILQLLVEADTEMKGGSRVDPKLLLERLFVRLAGEPVVLSVT